MISGWPCTIKMLLSKRSVAMPASSQPRLLSRDGLLCAALLGVCLLATWPVAEVGMNDDWVYTLIARDFARTGHLIFHGWASPLLGWQALWGAAFAKLFGPTFTSIRLSTIPLALATGLFLHAVLRRFGLNRAHANFGTLAFVMCPVFFALSDTFMTDVPALFAIIVCLYFCQSAAAASTVRESILWLSAAALSNIFFGTVRQVAWLGVLVIVPSCGWMLRRRRLLPQTTVALWIIGTLSIRWMTHWFAGQPYTAPEKLIPGALTRSVLFHFAVQAGRAAATTILLLLPVLAVSVSAIWPPRRAQTARIACGMAALGVVYAILHHIGRADFIQFPWIGNTISAHGILQDPPLFGSQRVVPLPWLLLVVGSLTFCILASAEMLWASRHNASSFSHAANQRIRGLSCKATAVLLLPFLAAYCVVLVPRAAFFAMFDRYLLEITAVLLIFFLRWHQEYVSLQIPRFAVATLAIVSMVSVAGTHDLFALSRAEVRLADNLQQSGIPRTEIRGGFAFDSQTQVEAMGYLNDPRIINPVGAYQPPLARPPVYDPACAYPFFIYLPAVDGRYVISADPKPCLAPIPFPTASFRTWLPPARRQLFAGTVIFSPRSPR